MKQQEYQIESILTAKFSSHRNRFFYLVKWLNWPVQDSTWEPEENFKHSQKILQQFKRKQIRNQADFQWENYESLRQFWKPEHQKKLKYLEAKKNRSKNTLKQTRKIGKQNNKTKKIQKPAKYKQLLPSRRKPKKDTEQIEIIEIKQNQESSSNQQNNCIISNPPPQTSITPQTNHNPKTDVHNKSLVLISQHTNPAASLSKNKRTSRMTISAQHSMQQYNQQSNKIKQTTKSLSSHQNSELSHRYESNSNYQMRLQPEQDQEYSSQQDSNRMDQDYVLQEEEVQAEVEDEEEDDDEEYQREFKAKQKYNFISESKLCRNSHLPESPFMENQQSHMNCGIFDDIIANRQKLQQPAGSQSDQAQSPDKEKKCLDQQKIKSANTNTNLNVEISTKNKSDEQFKPKPFQQPTKQSLTNPQILLQKQKYKIVGIRRIKKNTTSSKYQYSVQNKQNNMKKWMSKLQVFLNCPLSLIQFYEKKVDFNHPKKIKKQSVQ